MGPKTGVKKGLHSEWNFPVFLILVATRAAIYRSLRALRARNRKKVSKRVFSGVCRKVSKNTQRSLKIPKKYPKRSDFSVFLDFFGYFWGLFCRPPKRPFLRLFAIPGPDGPETPVNGGSRRKILGSVEGGSQNKVDDWPPEERDRFGVSRWSLVLGRKCHDSSPIKVILSYLVINSTT